MLFIPTPSRGRPPSTPSQLEIHAQRIHTFLLYRAGLGQGGGRLSAAILMNAGQLERVTSPQDLRANRFRGDGSRTIYPYASRSVDQVLQKDIGKGV